MKTIFVTGGAGFIGSAVIRYLINNTECSIINIDKLTYAGNLSTLESVANNPRYFFELADICDARKISELFKQYQPDAIMHLAAETHVDRSIDNAAAFIQTNIVGTYVLLEAARHYWHSLSETKKSAFRFHHISTDEVFGDLKSAVGFFTEMTPYAPNSPYSASKAGADHLVRAWYKTYGFPVILTNCSNNYGAFQFPEKLIPLMILNAVQGKKLPIYGNGNQVRDWLFVDDHARALYLALTRGKIGESYNIGGHNQKTNLEVVNTICTVLDELVPTEKNPNTQGVRRYGDLIEFAADRPGHDQRYAIDAGKIQRELGWQPLETFESGIRKTVEWYLDNPIWWQPILSERYCGTRLGLGS